MYLINRSAVVLKPLQPFADWINNLPNAPRQAIPLETLREDCLCFLMPDFEKEEDTERYIGDCYEVLFEESLFSCEPNEKHWPRDLSYEKFRHWFEIEVHGVVHDLMDEDIETIED